MQVTILCALFAVATIAFPTPANNASAGHHACFVTKFSDLPGCVTSGKPLIRINGPFTVPANQIMDLTKLPDNTHVILSGTVTFAKGTLNTDSALVTVAGNNIKFTSDSAKPGVLDGQGQLYWDGKGGNGGVPKPLMFRINTKTGLFSGFTLLNTPVRAMSVHGTSVTLDTVRVDNSLGDTKGGHNTDAFDVTGDGITIKNSWVHNQDDCLAINGATGGGVTFINNTCIGGHGISISTKATGVVENVHVQDCLVKDSANGIRIKTMYKSQSGQVSNVTYINVQLDNVSKYGLAIQQDYLNGGPTGKAISNTKISNIKVSYVHGSIKKGAKSSYILCAPGMCSGFNFGSVDIEPKNAACSGISPAPSSC